jgi:hypothetical protein
MAEAATAVVSDSLLPAGFPFCPQDVIRILPAMINDRMLRFIV